MKPIYLILGIMSVNIFFSVTSIIGYEYKGADESKVYILYCLIVAILNLVIFIKDFIQKKFYLRGLDLIILGIPVMVITSYFITKITNIYVSVYANNSIKYFLLWPAIAIYVGVYIVRTNKFYLIVKYMEVVMIVFSVAIIFSTIIPFIKGNRFDTLGGATYQTASYISAFAYGINLYFIFEEDNNSNRFNFTKVKGYNMLCELLLIIQVMGVFISGGRGGIILILLYTFYISSVVLKNKQKKNLFKYCKFILISIILIIVLVPLLMKNSIFRDGFTRVFQFISPSGSVNWKGTSGRDVVYLNAINLIKIKPILGYGFFGVDGYPHNIILDILLHKGVIGLIFSLIIFLFMFIKISKMIRLNKENRFIIIILLYCLTMLMFSGTYMNMSEIWFIIAYVFSYKINLCKEKKDEKDNFFCNEYF